MNSVGTTPSSFAENDISRPEPLGNVKKEFRLVTVSNKKGGNRNGATKQLYT